MVSHWSLKESLYAQVSQTLLSIPTDFKNAVVWIISIRPLISKSTSLCTNPFATVPMHHSQLVSPSLWYSTVFFPFSCKFLILTTFRFPSVLPCGQPERQCPLFDRLSFTWFPISWSVVSPRLSDPFVSQNPWELCVTHIPGLILGCTYTICSYSQISTFCTIPSRFPSPPSRVYSYTLLRSYINCL